jgi:acyl phosphate:glycerol-3-phosphate acyltransferase
MFTLVLMLAVAYLLGSLSSAIIVCKIMGLPDPRTQGSGNPGTTNVLRLGGKTPALITLAGDVLKGIVPIFIAHLFGVAGFGLALVGLAAFLGHLFPVFFKFEGGKGIATAFGVILSLSIPIAIAAAITWGIIVAVWRYVSLASLATAVLTPIYILLFGNHAYLLPVLIMTGMIIWRHWPNVQRLKNGVENKITF